MVPIIVCIGYFACGVLATIATAATLVARKERRIENGTRLKTVDRVEWDMTIDVRYKEGFAPTDLGKIIAKGMYMQLALKPLPAATIDAGNYRVSIKVRADLASLPPEEFEKNKNIIRF